MLNEQSTDRPKDRANDPPTARQVVTNVDRIENRPTSQPNDQPNVRHAKRTINRPSDERTERSTDRPTSEPNVRLTVGHSNDQPSYYTTEQLGIIN